MDSQAAIRESANVYERPCLLPSCLFSFSLFFRFSFAFLLALLSNLCGFAVEASGVDLLQMMMQYEPSRRISTKQVSAAQCGAQSARCVKVRMLIAHSPHYSAHTAARFVTVRNNILHSP
jgi:hypothetical protein